MFLYEKIRFSCIFSVVFRVNSWSSPLFLYEENVTQGQFFVEYSWFEFRDFFLLGWLPYKN